MAYFGISATDEGLRAAVPGVDVEGGLGAALAGVRRADAPVVVLVHGYRWHPDAPGGDPHRSLFALAPEPGDRRIRSWPEGLGFDDTGASGLCIGFGWPASAPHLRSLVATGRNGFARVYDTAGAVGARLAEVIRLVQRLAPGRPVDVFAHSLGAFSGTPEKVVIEFTAAEAPYVRERQFHSSQLIEELPGGRIRLTMDIVIDWELQAWVMGFGPAAKVIQPDAFARRIVESLEETRATYLRTE
jgi:hypothetical protein